MLAAARRAALLSSSAAASLSLYSGAAACAPPAAPPQRPTFAPCFDAACHSRADAGAWQPPTRVRSGIASGGSSGGGGGGGGADAAAAAGAGPRRAPCPPDREELGRATWTLLHAVAAYYPDAPSAAERGAAAALVSALCALYPCAHCRERLVADVAASAPRTESRTALARWVCEQHNAVNEALGKRAFPCELAALDERWRTGCSQSDDSSSLAAETSLGRASAAQEAAERAEG